MKIVIDENVAFAEEAFGKFGEVVLLNGRTISNSELRNADALIIRSITNVNENLLADTNVKFVGTATIGTEHVDKDFLKQKNIHFADAKGCNAYAVAEYVLSAVAKFVYQKNINFKDLTAGIIGYGNIGTKVEKFFNAVGMITLVNDPPLEHSGYNRKFTNLEDALACDIVTIHVPFSREGDYPTNYLVNERNILHLKPNALFINTSRGEVVDSLALLNAITNNKIKAVLDVWEDEPIIDNSLLEKVFLATPHVAGYSLEGKVNGTKIIYDEFCRCFNLQTEWQDDFIPLKNNTIEIDSESSIEEILFQLTNYIYKIEKDSLRLKKTISLIREERGAEFDKFRKNYNLRREFNNYKILLSKPDNKLMNILEQLRFSVG